MAKKKLSRKEQKEQQRQMVEAKRQEREWIAPERGIVSAPSSDVVEDMASLFSGGRQPSRKDVERLMQIVVESDELAAEPEFEEILFDPMLSLNQFMTGAEDRGFGPEDLDTLEAEEYEGIWGELVEEVTIELLTPELRQEILDALDDLRLRLKEEGEIRRVAEVAAVQASLQGGLSKTEEWANVGLVHQLASKSIQAGFELFAKAAEVFEQTGIDPTSEESMAELLEKITPFTESEAGRQWFEQLNQVPGLAAYMEKESDTIWSAGLDALFKGDLYLNIFSASELARGSDVFDSYLSKAESDEEKTAILERDGPAMMAQIQEYVQTLITDPRWLDKAGEALGAALADPLELDDQEQQFVQMGLNDLKAGATAEDMLPFFMRAFLGELRVAMREAREFDQGWDYPGVLDSEEQAQAFYEHMKQIRGSDVLSDEVWTAGLQDLYNGDLWLELYSDEELDEASAAISNFLVPAEDEAAKTARLQQDGATLVVEIEQRIQVIFASPGRLEELKSDLQSILATSETLNENDDQLIRRVVNSLQAGEGIEQILPFLVHALLGEVRDDLEMIDELDSEWEEE